MWLKLNFTLFVLSLGISCFADENIQEFAIDADKETKIKPELKIEVLHKPAECDENARKTQRLDVLNMKYTGFLSNGSKFESSLDSDQEFSFQLGVGQVIQGWEKGLLDMCIGEKRKLTIPPHLAYGDIGAGDKIPPKATLIFEIELMKIDDGPKPRNVFRDIDANGDGKLSQEEVEKFLVMNSQEAGEMIDTDSEEHKKTIKNIFKHEDKDEDGFISLEEFSGPKTDHDEL